MFVKNFEKLAQIIACEITLHVIYYNQATENMKNIHEWSLLKSITCAFLIINIVRNHRNIATNHPKIWYM